MGDHASHDRSKQGAAATAGPRADDRFGPGPVGTDMGARILAVAVTGERTRVTLSRGKNHGVHVGMEGYIKAADGMLSELQVDAVEDRRCHAFVEVTPDQLRHDKLVMLNPTSMPRSVITKEVSARVIAVTVEKKDEKERTKIIIARGSTHGVVAGMRGHLASADGHDGGDFTIEGTTARQSYAYVAGTVDQVNRHQTAVLQPRPAARPSPIQRRANGAAVASNDVPATAEAGVAGASSRLPHFDTIQRAFGKHDISGVRAQVGGAATEATAALGAQAYATVDKIAFAAPPDLHTAAHEAAHAIQQRRGVVGFQGLGSADDEHERHADVVADAVVAGESAEPALDQLGVGGTGSSQAVQRRTTPPIVGKASTEPHENIQARGEQWEQQGACVRDNPGIEGCFLSNGARESLLRNLHSRADSVRTNYKMAASELKTDEKLRKESDFSFIPTLYKEFMVGALIGAIAKGVIKLRGGAKDEAQIFTDEAIKSVTRSLGGYATKQAEGAVKRDLGKGSTNEKLGKLAYLDQVQNDVDMYFDELILSFGREATDVYLQTLYEGFHPQLNMVAMLRDGIAQKLQRFVSSGVLQIGRGPIRKPTEGGDVMTVQDDRRVVWIWVGSAKELFYEHHESRFGTSGDAAYGTTNSRNDGTRRYGKPVPREFWTQAEQASEAKWGKTPAVMLDSRRLNELNGRKGAP
jgi:Domain of unknown function (DUF4157)